jgi:hypothetical protein
MEFLQDLLRILDSEMRTPEIFGWFHILWLGLTALATFGLCLWHKKYGTQKHVPKVVFVVSLFAIILEIYKQINYSFSYTGGIDFDYTWYAFPFQFCSTPMYVGLLVGIIRKGKVHDALCAYLATFSIFAGTCVMLYPGDVFIDTIGINIQTMICHGSMVVLGIYLLVSGYVKLEHKTILKAMCVFAIAVALAAVMNEIAHFSGLEETFNMFFVSRYFESTLPVYGAVHNAVPFPLNLVIYILGFTLASYIILLIAMGIHKIFVSGYSKTHNSQAIA